LATEDREYPVDGFDKTTCAPGTAPPEASVTVPRREVVAVCGIAGLAKYSASQIPTVEIEANRNLYIEGASRSGASMPSKSGAIAPLLFCIESEFECKVFYI
jgi:hypothetical protein